MITAAMVTPNLTLGGAERWVVDLVKHSDPARIKWVGVAMSSYGGADPGLAAELAKHTKLFANKTPPGTVRPLHAKPFCWDSITEITGPNFRDTVQKAAEGAQVIVTWGQPTMRYWFQGMKIPRVLCSHSTHPEEALRPIEDVTHLTAVSTAAMKYFAGRQGYADLPKTIIYNGADPDRCRVTVPRDEMRASWGVGPKDFVVGYLGRQSEEKNPLAPVEAISDLPPHFHAVYYGYGPNGQTHDEDLRSWCDSLAPGRYHFCTPRHDVGNVLNGFDVLMLASHREAFSLSLIESWLCSVPVIATPVGSVPELERKFGRLTFPTPRNPTPKDLKIALELCQMRLVRSQVIRRAWQTANEHFTIQKMAERWASYLEDVVAGRI